MLQIRDILHVTSVSTLLPPKQRCSCIQTGGAYVVQGVHNINVTLNVGGICIACCSCTEGLFCGVHNGLTSNL